MAKIRDNYELEAIQGKIRPRNDQNVRPGDRMGLTTEQVREYIARQKKCKGFSLALTIGDNNTMPVKLPGTARVMLGFALKFSRFGAADPDGKVTLMVNNEVMIEDVNVQFFGKDFTDQEYYFLPRPVSGNDDIKMIFKGVTFVYTVDSNFYYL